MNKKYLSILLITLLIIGNISPVFADTDSIDNYDQIEYLESSGGQYINTGINPSSYLNNLVIEADMGYSVIPTGSGTQSYLFGTGYYSSTNTNRRNIVFGYRGSTSTSYFSMLNGGQLSDVVASTVQLDTSRHTFKIDQINKIYSIDSYTRSFSSTVSSNLSNSILIFAARQSGSSGAPIGYYSSAKLYSFKIYNGSVLLRNYVPVKRKSDNEFGLYDLVNDQFYTNSGTGSFNGGLANYNVTVTINPVNGGSVTGAGSYVQGSYATLTASAASGYTFTGWSDGSVANPYTFLVNQSVNITANFSPSVQTTYTVSTSVDPAGSGIVTGAGTYTDGDTVELIATPNEGYIFKNWSDGGMYATRYFIIHNNVNLTAFFEEEENEYDVILSVYPEGSGTVTGDGTYERGETATIQAIPEEGYEFVNWSDGNIANPRTVTVDHTIDLTANFRVISEPIDNNDQLSMIILLVSFLILLSFGKGVNYD